MNQNEYAHNCHWEWIQKMRPEHTMSELGKEVANILGYVGRGIYNAPINHRKIDWEDPYVIEVCWSRSMANWDFPSLTELVIECHRRMIRVEIEGATVRRIRMLFHQRTAREGSTTTRLPDIEEMIKRQDEFFGRKDKGETDELHKNKG